MAAKLFDHVGRLRRPYLGSWIVTSAAPVGIAVWLVLPPIQRVQMAVGRLVAGEPPWKELKIGTELS